MNKFLLKEAVVGPLAEIPALGLPSAVGYQFGKAEGRDLAQARKKAPAMLGASKDEVTKTKNMAAIALVPGSTGYLVGKRAGYRQELEDSLKEWKEELASMKKGGQPTKKYKNRVVFLKRNIRRNTQLLKKMSPAEVKAPNVPKAAKPKKKTSSVSEKYMTTINVETFRSMGDAFLKIAAEEMVAVKNHTEDWQIPSDRREVIFTKLSEIRKEAMVKQASVDGFIDELTKIAHTTGDENLLKLAQSEMTKEAIAGLVGKGLGWASRGASWLKGLPDAAGRAAAGVSTAAKKWWQSPGIWQKYFDRPFRQGYGTVVNPGKLRATQAAGGGFATARASAGKTTKVAPTARTSSPQTTFHGDPARGTVKPPQQKDPVVIVRGERGVTGKLKKPRVQSDATNTYGPAVTGTRGQTGAVVDGVRVPPRTTTPRSRAARDAGDAPLPAAASRAEDLGNQAALAMGGSVGATPGQLAIAREAAGTGRAAAPAAAVAQPKGSPAVIRRKGKGKKKGNVDETAKGGGAADDAAKGGGAADDAAAGAGGQGGVDTGALVPQGVKDWWGGLNPATRTAVKWGGGAGTAGLFLGGAMG